jgi:multiple sugar transport system permease protein
MSLPEFPPRRNSAIKIKKGLGILTWELVLLIVGILMAVPFIWMLTTSLKERSQVFAFPPTFIPDPIQWSNYKEVWTRDIPMVQAYLNSIKITLLVTLGTLFNCSIAGYAFAKIKFPGSGLLFGILLATMMIPGQVTLVPMYILMARIGWVDSHLPLIVPPIMVNAFGVFLMRQFFLNVPDELLDAARIDGASPFQMFAKVSIPLVKPAMVTLAIFTILSSWNSFLGPLIYLNTPEKFTVPLVINYFTSVVGGTEWSVMMAAITTALAPIILIYLVFQRYFIQGIARTGIKG